VYVRKGAPFWKVCAAVMQMCRQLRAAAGPEQLQVMPKKVKGKSRNSGACLRVQPSRQGVLRQLDVYFCMVCGCAVLL
jgi:hypothetical protein